MDGYGRAVLHRLLVLFRYSARIPHEALHAQAQTGIRLAERTLRDDRKGALQRHRPGQGGVPHAVRVGPVQFRHGVRKEKMGGARKSAGQIQQGTGRRVLRQAARTRKTGQRTALHAGLARTDGRLAQKPDRQHSVDPARHQQGPHAADRLLRHAHTPFL